MVVLEAWLLAAVDSMASMVLSVDELFAGFQKSVFRDRGCPD